MAQSPESRRKSRVELREWAQSLPKVDLHRHLEGSLRLSTLADIAIEHGIDLPSYDIELLRPYVQFTEDQPDFHGFLSKFELLRRFYTSQEAVQRLARETVMDAAEDNIRYLEVRFNPVALARGQNFPLSDVVEWVVEAISGAQAESGTRTCLILQVGREEDSDDVINEIVELAMAYFGPLVRGIDLAGNELKYPDYQRFSQPFQQARDTGLHVTVHAGEALGAESIRSALNLLHPQRIGHGIRAVENSDVVRKLYENATTLEICPTSNLQTGAVRGMTQHPLMDLYSLRLRVTLNTDDPSISDTTLSDEYVVAVNAIGMRQQHIYRMLRYAADAAFIPDAERPWLMLTLRRELAAYPGALAAFDALL
jgi:adenosine deaminase